MRMLIEVGTRVFTESDKAGINAFMHKISAKHIPRPSRLYSRASVLKTHFPRRRWTIRPEATHAVVLLRSPFDALVAEYKREVAEDILTKHYTDYSHYTPESLHTFVMKNKDFPAIGRFGGWVEKALEWHTAFLEYWALGSVTYANNVSLDSRPVALRDIVQTDPVSGIRFARHVVHVPHRKTLRINVLLLFYEDFVWDMEAALRTLFSFLKSIMLGAMAASVEDAVRCALETDIRAGDSYLRAGKRVNPWARFPKLVNELCELYGTRYWVPELWGPCDESISRTHDAGGAAAHGGPATRRPKREHVVVDSNDLCL